MAGTITCGTLSDGTNSTSSTNCIQGSAKAWVNFNGTVATPTIRASYNVGSVTKLSTGYYQVNFTNALADANYSVSGSAIWGNNTVSPVIIAAGSCNIICGYVTNTSGGGAGVDNSTISVQFFR